MHHVLSIDADHGISGSMLLGALLDLGAPAPQVREDVSSLGDGDARMSWVRVTRGDTPALIATVRAPKGTADLASPADAERILLAATMEPAVKAFALNTLRIMHDAVAAEEGIARAELVLAPAPALDNLALAVAISSALVRTRVQHAFLLGDIAVGHATKPEDVDPVVASLLAELPTTPGTGPHPAPTDRMGAAWIVALEATPEGIGGNYVGLGRGAHAGVSKEAVLRLLLHPFGMDGLP